MSVLKRGELAESPLADLHQIASELGVEGYRAMRKDDLIAAILGETGAAADEAEQAGDAREEAAGETPEEAAGDAPEEAAGETPEEAAGDAPEDEPDEVPADEALERPARRGRRGGEEEPEVVEDELSDDQIATGVLDVLANGSGFLRVDAAGQSREDVYVSPAQIRRCELRAGDKVSGPARGPRRNERHRSLVRIESVNGGSPEPVEGRPRFEELTPVFPTERLSAPKALKDAPFGRGSRVAIVGPPGAGATTLLRELADELSGNAELHVQVVLVGVRPEEVTDWRRSETLTVAGGGFDRSPDAQAQAAELALERAKRRAERGGHAVVLLDSLEALAPGARRRVFGAGRATEEAGTLTVIATAGAGGEVLRWATTRIMLEPRGKLSPASGTLRADALS